MPPSRPRTRPRAPEKIIQDLTRMPCPNCGTRVFGEPDKDKLFSTEDASTYLGVTASTMINWRRHGPRGPAFTRVGRKNIKYRQSDLDKWLLSQETRPEPQTAAG